MKRDYVLLPPVVEQRLGRSFVDYAGDGAAWLNQAVEQGWEKAVRNDARDRLDLAEKLGHDLPTVNFSECRSLYCRIDR